MIFVIIYQLPGCKPEYFTDFNGWTSHRDFAARWKTWIYVCDMLKVAVNACDDITAEFVQIKTIDYHGVLDELARL